MAEHVDPSKILANLPFSTAPDQLPDLGPGPRAGAQTEMSLNKDLDQILADTGLRPGHEKLVRSLLLLWHDHLDASHDISQEVGSSDGSYVHGLMHRREPDYGNAKYWFRQVGDHPCFEALAVQATELLSHAGKDEWVSLLISGGHWDSFAMVDLCESLSGHDKHDPDLVLARQLQALEFEVLLRHLCQ